MLFKQDFELALREFTETLNDYATTKDGQWTIKGFIDTFRNVYTISSDTKIISKILEIHLFPKILAFAQKYNYQIILAEHQNYYPDISFIYPEDSSIKFAVDFKTTYRNPDKPWLCNGFTLGSHGQYFQDRTSSNKSGSGNTANIGSIQNIEDILQGRGMFSRLGEDWFDDYWMNFGKITTKDSTGKTKKISSLEDFVKYRQGDISLIVKRDNAKP